MLLLVANGAGCRGGEVATTEVVLQEMTPAKLAPVHVQVLAFNDFHGHLERPHQKIDGQQAGGAVYLAGWIDALRGNNPNTFVVSAGDLIGGSPLASALFHDEPTIDVMNAIGLDFNAVGNHEFDEGVVELQRMQQGGCHPQEKCREGRSFAGADFEFLAANVLTKAKEAPLFPSYAIREVQGIKLAFIGMTLEATPNIVAPDGIATVTFEDEVETVNALIPELRAQGVETVLVLLHEGGEAEGGINGCESASGPIVAIAETIDPAVDVLITGHTHKAYNCIIGGKRVTSAGAYGLLLTEIELDIDPQTGDVIDVEALNHITTSKYRSSEVQALVEKAVAMAAPRGERVVGYAEHGFSRERDAAGQSPLGALIADAQLEASLADGADVALMNPGGIRAELKSGEVTYAELFAVQPFGNTLTAMSLRGAELHALLEEQFEVGRILQVSAGFYYRFDPLKAPGHRVDPASIAVDGRVVAPDDEVRIVVNNFLAEGGDGFQTFAVGRERKGGPVDLEALAEYLHRHSPVSPSGEERVHIGSRR